MGYLLEAGRWTSIKFSASAVTKGIILSAIGEL